MEGGPLGEQVQGTPQLIPCATLITQGLQGAWGGRSGPALKSTVRQGCTDPGQAKQKAAWTGWAQTGTVQPCSGPGYRQDHPVLGKLPFLQLNSKCAMESLPTKWWGEQTETWRGLGRARMAALKSLSCWGLGGADPTLGVPALSR
jgi:hypothetical protein